MNWHNELLQAKAWLRWGQEKLGCDYAINIEFNNRLKSRAGDANSHHMRIRLSPEVWAAAPESERRDTVLHEFAHIYTDKKYWVRPFGSRPSAHGWQWKTTMRELGLAPNRCHKVVTPRMEAKRANSTPAYCRCMEHRLSKVKMNKIARGLSYVCKKCRSRLYLTKERAMA